MKCWTSSGMSPRRSRSGGTLHRDDVQAEEQVLAEAPRRDLGLEVAVGRGDDAHVDLDRLGRADAADLALLQHAQQLHLHLGAISPISSRKSVPPVASSKRPRFVRAGAR